MQNMGVSWHCELKKGCSFSWKVIWRVTTGVFINLFKDIWLLDKRFYRWPTFFGSFKNNEMDAVKSRNWMEELSFSDDFNKIPFRAFCSEMAAEGRRPSAVLPSSRSPLGEMLPTGIDDSFCSRSVLNPEATEMQKRRP
ncbi:hypothetical protein IEQ34_021344 [Dendrobium chrysotoxum]|uniref:Uncharacterized protein n=1 Tax=Dendrobium chrysotoxum TaxID=161865 RepID=A0AAV7G4K5_DENCH|nr:hypothetical protein IEQ34_021344 [Dendrobium chrysotoxum]